MKHLAGTFFCSGGRDSDGTGPYLNSCLPGYTQLSNISRYNASDLHWFIITGLMGSRL
jgi:hypothetical protein